MKMPVMLTIMLLGWVAGERTAQAAEVFVEAGVGIGLAYILLGAGLMLLVVGKACAA